MKKILFALVALVCCMSMNAQIMKVMKNGVVVTEFDGADYTFVFEKDPYTRATFLKGVPLEGSDFTGFESSTLTASNDDVKIELALSSNSGEPIWNPMGDIMMGIQDSKLTITVTPKKAGVTVSGIEYLGESKVVTKTGAGPWQFDVRGDRVYDGSTPLGGFNGIVVKYKK